jgi:hypothetical protein
MCERDAAMAESAVSESFTSAFCRAISSTSAADMPWLLITTTFCMNAIYFSV